MCEYLGSDSQNVRIKNNKPNTSMNTQAIKAALANLETNTALCDLPDSEFVTGGAITNACREAGYDESGRAAINQLNVWKITVGELEAMLCSQKKNTLTLAEAIAEAMTDKLETGSFNKHNPCVYSYADSYHYGSAMEPHDAIIVDLQEGLGGWTPEIWTDIKACSEGFARSISQ